MRVDEADRSHAEIQNSFTDLGWAQSERLNRGLAAWPSPGSAQWARATGDDVIKRNRYANVEVFVNNRVKLNVPEGHSDYINASYIKLRTTESDTEKCFIATQVLQLHFSTRTWLTSYRVQKKKLKVICGV
jgi:protein-tyrosine phosphatase